MPLIDPSSYVPPALFSNGHIQTIFPALLRKVDGVFYHRERIATPDEDFLDLDWSRKEARRLGVVCHGLEGDSTRPYVMGMVRALNGAGWDALAWNYRGCGGEINRRLRFYHSGETGDLGTVIAHAVASGAYEKVALIGFSAGGNIVLKYLGEQGDSLAMPVCGAAAFSVPCDLGASARRLADPGNRFYLRRFLKLLHEKIRRKMELMPGEIDDRDYDRIKTFKEFDDRYTARLFGFKDAEDYWRRASCKPYLERIRVPALLVNALDDPFLTPECRPVEQARRSPCFFLELPGSGGHVGFVSFAQDGRYWSERRAVEFLDAT